MVFSTNMSEHCGVVETTGRVRHGDIRLFFYEAMDLPRSLAYFCTDENSVVGGYSYSSSDGGGISSSGAPSSGRNIVHWLINSLD